jgi:CheY-like chemotaxis protein
LEAADGKKGLAMILEKHPNLVILDINMPKKLRHGPLKIAFKITDEQLVVFAI